MSKSARISASLSVILASTFVLCQGRNVQAETGASTATSQKIHADIEPDKQRNSRTFIFPAECSSSESFLASFRGNRMGRGIQEAGPIGAKSVTIGEIFLVESDNGEIKEMQTTINRSCGNVNFPAPDYRDNFEPDLQCILQLWDGSLPGEAQVSVSVIKGGKIESIKFTGWLPGVDRDGNVVNETKEPGIEKRFYKQVNDCLNQASQMNYFKNIDLSGRKCVTMSMIFGADAKSLLHWNNLEWTSSFPKDELSIQNARLQFLLYSAGFFDSAARCRSNLPLSFSNYLDKYQIDPRWKYRIDRGFTLRNDEWTTLGSAQNTPSQRETILGVEDYVNLLLRDYAEKRLLMQAELLIKRLDNLKDGFAFAEPMKNKRATKKQFFSVLSTHLSQAGFTKESALMETKVKLIR